MNPNTDRLANGPPMPAEVEAKLAAIVRAVLDLPPDMDVTDAEQAAIGTWDSLAHVSLMLALESEFGISIDVTDQVRLTSYRAIRDCLAERR